MHFAQTKQKNIEHCFSFSGTITVSTPIYSLDAVIIRAKMRLKRICISALLLESANSGSSLHMNSASYNMRRSTRSRIYSIMYNVRTRLCKIDRFEWRGVASSHLTSRRQFAPTGVRGPQAHVELNNTKQTIEYNSIQWNPCTALLTDSTVQYRSPVESRDQ